MQENWKLFSKKLQLFLITMDNLLGIRMEQIRKLERLELEEYMQILGATTSSYYNWRDGKNYPNVSVIIKLLERFPKYNSDWVLLGIGEMLKGSNSLEIASEPKVGYANREMIRDEIKQFFKEVALKIEKM